MNRDIAGALLRDWAEAEAATTGDQRRCLSTYPTSEVYVAAWLRGECARRRCGPRVSTVFWCRDPEIDTGAVDGKWVPTAEDLRRIVCGAGPDDVYLVKRVPRVPLAQVGQNGTVLQRWLWAFDRGEENVSLLCGELYRQQSVPL